MATIEPIEIYKYPSDITNPEYEHRKVFISIKKPSYEVAAETIYDKSVKILDATLNRTPAVATTPKDTARNKKGNSSAKRDETVDTIILPLPNNFEDTQSHDWSSETGVLGTVGATLTSTNLSDILGSGVDKDGKNKSGPINKLKRVFGKLSNGLDVNKSMGSAAAIAGARKPLVDPGYFQNYAGSKPRSFTLSWEFVPNNRDEANQIIMIIMKLREYSSPTSGGFGIGLLSPYFLNVEISNDIISSMISLDRVVISNISVNYSVDGAMQQTHDGMPKHISLTLSLEEVNMTVADDFNSRPELPSKQTQSAVPSYVVKG